MNIDEEKALRLRKARLEAELRRINQLLHDQAVVDFESERANYVRPISRRKTWFERWKERWRGFRVGEDYPDTMPITEEEPAHPVKPKPKKKFRSPSRIQDRDDAFPPSPRDQFYKDVENDFRNTDSNGNYTG